MFNLLGRVNIGDVDHRSWKTFPAAPLAVSLTLTNGVPFGDFVLTFCCPKAVSATARGDSAALTIRCGAGQMPFPRTRATHTPRCVRHGR